MFHSFGGREKKLEAETKAHVSSAKGTVVAAEEKVKETVQKALGK